MKKVFFNTLLFLFIALFLISYGEGDGSVAKKAGLGDTFTAIDAAWDRGYRKEIPLDHGAKKVVIGIERERAISYTTGIWGNTFGNPERAGLLEGNAKGLFGAGRGINPTKPQFFAGIKDLMPKDSVLKETYIRDVSDSKFMPWRKEVYVFMSNALTHLPGIKKVACYEVLKEPVGRFTLIVNYDIDDVGRVANFILSLCTDNTIGMKKVSLNPFK